MANILYGHIVSNLIIQLCFVKSVGVGVVSSAEEASSTSSMECTRGLIALLATRDSRHGRLKATRAEFMGTRKTVYDTSMGLYFDEVQDYTTDIVCGIQALCDCTIESAPESVSESVPDVESMVPVLMVGTGSVLEESVGSCSIRVLDIKQFEHPINMPSGGIGSNVGLFGTFRMRVDAAIEKYWKLIDSCFNNFASSHINSSNSYYYTDPMLNILNKEYVHTTWKQFYSANTNANIDTESNENENENEISGSNITSYLYARDATDAKRTESIIPKTVYSDKHLKNSRIFFTRKLNNCMRKNEKPLWLKDRFHLNQKGGNNGGIGVGNGVGSGEQIENAEGEWCSGSEEEDENDNINGNVNGNGGVDTYSGIFGSVESALSGVVVGATAGAGVVERSMRSVPAIERWWNHDNDVALMKEALRVLLVKRADGIPKRLLPCRDDSTRVLSDGLFVWWEESIYSRLLQYGTSTVLPSDLDQLLSENASLDSSLHSICANIASSVSTIEINKRSTIVRIVYGRDLVTDGSEKVNALMVRFVNKRVGELVSKYNNVYKMVLYIITADAKKKCVPAPVAIPVAVVESTMGSGSAVEARGSMELVNPNSMVGTVARSVLMVSQYADLKAKDRQEGQTTHYAADLLQSVSVSGGGTQQSPNQASQASQVPEWKNTKTKTLLRTKLLQVYFCVAELLQIREKIANGSGSVTSPPIATSTLPNIKNNTSSNSIINYYTLTTLKEVDCEIKRRINYFNDFMSDFDGLNTNSKRKSHASTSTSTSASTHTPDRCEMEAWWYGIIVAPVLKLIIYFIRNIDIVSCYAVVCGI